MWKGAAANLNNNATTINIAAIVKLVTSLIASIFSSGENIIYVPSPINDVSPVSQYINADPNKSNPELTAPSKKYLILASVLYCPSLFIPANIYNDKLINSIDKYKLIKSFEDTSNNIPSVDNIIN
jgi:hypothetical protein